MSSGKRTEADQQELEWVLSRTAEAMPPKELAATARAAMLDRIKSRAREASPEGTLTVRAWSKEWVQILPHVRLRMLNVDAESGTHISLVRMEAGGVLPAHRHSRDEEFVVLEGECHIGNHLLTEGDVHRASAGSFHGPVTTRSGVLVYLRGEFPFPGAHR